MSSKKSLKKVQAATHATKYASNDISPDTLLAFLPTSAEGYLLKKGRRLGGWVKAYYVLKGSVLVVFKKRSDPQPAKYVDLSGYKCVTFPQVRGCDGAKVFGFEHPEHRALQFCLPKPKDGQKKKRRPLTVQDWTTAFARSTQKVTRDDFEVLKMIGSGSYGKVFLVRKKNTKALYAMKEVPKDLSKTLKRNPDESESDYVKRINRQNAKNIRYITGERSTLQTVNHSSIVKLQYAFQTKDSWYLVMDYCQGGDLFEHVASHPENRFPESIVRQWAAELVCALEHMHGHGIVHRDIKLENILMDLDGHVRLGDWGFARSLILPNGQLGYTSYFCGTKYYIAPEMLVGDRTYNTSVDWWSLGVLIYECLTGTPPFYSRNRDRQYQKIVKNPVVFHHPERLSEDARDFIKKLLTKDPRRRLGHREGAVKNGLTEIRRHPFFDGVNWDEVEAGNMQTIFKPPDMLPRLDDDSKAEAELARSSNTKKQMRLYGFSYIAEFEHTDPEVASITSGGGEAEEELHASFDSMSVLANVKPLSLSNSTLGQSQSNITLPLPRHNETSVDDIKLTDDVKHTDEKSTNDAQAMLDGPELSLSENRIVEAQ